MLSKRETSRFCGQLKTMLMAGIPLLEALLIIQEHPSQGKRTSTGLLMGGPLTKR